MGECVVCGKETSKTLHRKAIMPIYICSETCLQKYFKPLGGLNLPPEATHSESWIS